MTRPTPRRWPTEGDEPDPRWSLANERTLLAYQRTGLGLLVAGFAVAGSRSNAEAPTWFALIGLPLIVLGGVVAVEGHYRYLHAQRAMRTGEPLGMPRASRFLPWGIAAIATIGLVAASLHLLIGD